MLIQWLSLPTFGFGPEFCDVAVLFLVTLFGGTGLLLIFSAGRFNDKIMARKGLLLLAVGAVCFLLGVYIVILLFLTLAGLFGYGLIKGTILVFGKS